MSRVLVIMWLSNRTIGVIYLLQRLTKVEEYGDYEQGFFTRVVEFSIESRKIPAK